MNKAVKREKGDADDAMTQEGEVKQDDEGDLRMSDEVRSVNLVSTLDLNEENVTNRAVRNQLLLEVRRKDYAMIMGVIKEALSQWW